MELQAPVVAVTVHPRRARVTRRGRVELSPGGTELVVAGLPESLLEESVRVAGRTGEGSVRIVGVDLVHRDVVEAPDERVRAAEDAVLAAERALAAVDGTDAGDAAREQLLGRLAVRSGDRLAAARRANAENRAEAQRALDAAHAELNRLRSSGRHRRDAVVGVEADLPAGAADGARVGLELELTYVVEGASWTPAYDARLVEGPDGAGDTVTLTSFGMVTQATGEDWPPVELTLSTARPATATSVPELDPWWVEAQPEVMPVMAMAAAAPAPGGMRQRGGAQEFAKVSRAVEAVAVGSSVSASWRLARPTAVPGDGTPHRTTITTVELPARLDHVTAPAVSPDAHLRATVTNTGGQTLVAGPVSTFSGDAFVGTTAIEQTAPGGEIELALGVDDRIAVEREQVERTAHKARFGSHRGAVERWTITVTNGRTGEARVTVRDRLPVSRTAEIKVVDVALSPEPAERDELGRVEWAARLAPGARWRAEVRFGVEHPKDMRVRGWR